MPYYCPHCRQVIETVRCPVCRKYDGYEVRADDLCLFTEQNSVWAEILDDVLKQEKIPAVRRVANGIAPLIGSAMARWQFFVPYAYLEQAKGVLNELTEPVGEDEATEEADESADF